MGDLAKTAILYCFHQFFKQVIEPGIIKAKPWLYIFFGQYFMVIVKQLQGNAFVMLPIKKGMSVG
jgi:hypothetical protein